MKLFDQTMSMLERSLDYSSLKNSVISNNIANVDTPNYKAKNVEFKSVLNEALTNQIEAKRTHPKHIPFSIDRTPFQIVSNQQTMYNHNRNNVDIDKEMSELAKNQIYYRGLVDRINGKFSTLQTVIRGGR